MLFHRQGKSPRVNLYVQTTARKSVSDGSGQRLTIADLADRLNRCREVGSVVAEHRSMRSDLGRARWCIGICPEVVVETPGAYGFSQRQHFRCVSWIGNVSHHAVESGEVLRHKARVFPVSTNANERS